MKGEKCKKDLSSLSETNWIVKTLDGQPPLPGRPLTLNFENGRVFGSAGCNSYFGSYTEDANGKLQIGRVGTTRMLCHPNEIMTQEAQFSEMLEKVAGYCLTADGSLTLNDAKGEELSVFTPQSQGLAGTSWQAAFVEGVSLVAGSKITAEFGPDGMIFGSAGCNSYSGRYIASSADKTLEMGLISTRMRCHEPAGVMEQEKKFLIAMDAAATYRIEAGWLTIRKADGSSAVRFFKDVENR
ncbi:MAG: META domain-containing protein [Candidatus Electrothrix sp. AW2]|nr:META domain-containing protein [Candidatus Electrothrix gigas]